MPRVPKYIFCQCMKLDARDLLDIWSIDLYSHKGKIPFNIDYDFINLKPSNSKFICRFDNKTNKP